MLGAAFNGILCSMAIKLLFVSDSHRDVSRMLYAAEKTKPDVIIHLGDHISDARELQRRYPGASYRMLLGNCDLYAAGEAELSAEFEGVVIYASHGHAQGVKQGLDALAAEARRRGAALAAFGHTHQPLVRRSPGLCLLNPGQMARHDAFRAASYAVVAAEGGSFSVAIEYLPL